MNLIVQKFGGSSVADAGKLLHISRIVKAAREAGHDVIVVVSAQGDTTDTLMDKAREVSALPARRETDALLCAGEQMSAALTALALEAQGVPAVSLNAWQVPVRTNAAHGDGRIEGIGRGRVLSELAGHRVVVVTGFQGVDPQGNVTTLGRGGSDYTAVALSAAFGAARCLIYTDVDGVYTADPRLCPGARRLPCVSYEDMYALSRWGAQVLHDKCVALAQERGVEPVVLSCAGGEGTRVGRCPEARPVTGVTLRSGEKGAAVTLVGPRLPSLAAQKQALLALEKAGIPVRSVEAPDRALTVWVDPEKGAAALRAVHDAVLAPA